MKTQMLTRLMILNTLSLLLGNEMDLRKDPIILKVIKMSHSNKSTVGLILRLLIFHVRKIRALSLVLKRILRKVLNELPDQGIRVLMWRYRKACLQDGKQPRHLRLFLELSAVSSHHKLVLVNSIVETPSCQSNWGETLGRTRYSILRRQI